MVAHTVSSSPTEGVDWECSNRLRWNGDVLEQMWIGYFWESTEFDYHGGVRRGPTKVFIADKVEWRPVPKMPDGVKL